MGRKRSTPEQIITKLRQAEVELAKGETAGEPEIVKTSLEPPRELWKAAHILAMDEKVDFQTIVAKALEAYLLKKAGGR